MHQKTNKKTNTYPPSLPASRIATTGLIIAFVFALSHSITSIDRQPILPYMPAATLGSLVISALICVFTQKNLSTYLRKTVSESLFIGLNIFGLIILFSTIYSKFPLLTLSRSLQFIIVTNSMYYLLTQVENLRVLFESITKLTIYFMLAACIYGLFIFFFGIDSTSNNTSISYVKFLGIELQQRLYGQRISSFIGNPNPFGFRLMIAILFCLYFIREYKSRWYAFLFIILLYTLILTQSRASALGLVVAASFFFYCVYIDNHRNRNFIIVIFLSVFIVFALYISLNTSAFEALYSIMGDRASALSRRDEAWVALLSQIKDTPWLGIGYRISTEYVLRGNLIDIYNSHNLYLAILTEVGIVGFLSLLWIYLTPFIAYAFQRHNYKTVNTLQITTLTILLAFLVNQGFEEMFTSQEFPFMTTVLLLYITHQTLPFRKRLTP